MAKKDKKTEIIEEETSESKLEKTETIVKKRVFNLSEYKRTHNLDNVKFKPQEWLVLPQAFQEATGVPGFPIGHISLLRGHSDTSKTTAMVLAAIEAQKKEIIPVFIVTEMKWSWEHAKLMGLQFTEVKNEKGEVDGYDGFFIYADRSQLKTIEGVAKFINDLLDQQEKGELPYSLLFVWDSIGSVPCNMSVEKGKNNNEWNAGAMSVQFGSHINQRFGMSRKEDYPYTNTFICVNKVWVQKPENPMGQPKMKNKGGETMYLDSTFVITFGNVTGAGTNKIKATKNGKEVMFGTRVKVQVEKNHINGISTTSKIIVTPTGYIKDDKKEIDLYKKANMNYFMDLLGENGGDFDTVIEDADEPDVIVEEPEE